MVEEKEDTVIHANFGGKHSEDGGKEMSEALRVIKDLESRGLRFIFCVGYNEQDQVEVVYGGALANLSQFVGDLEIAKAMILKNFTTEV